MTDTYMTSSEAYREIRRGARKQGAVIKAILFKDLRIRLGKGRLGLLWVILEPMTQMFVLSALWYLAGRQKIDGVHVTMFIATGIIPYMILKVGINKIHHSIKSNVSLFDYQQVKPIDALLAAFILNLVLILFASIALFFVLDWFFEVSADFPNIPEMLGILAVLMCFSLGIGLLISVYGVFYESLPRFCNIITKPLIFISGVVYSVNDLPATTREVLSWNPLLQFIAYVRHYVLGLDLIPEANFVYIGLISAVTLFVGCLSYYVNRLKLLQR
ncbi:MAG: ABC transporter permease [Rhizobiales bacterium]|nr:ABC transporter permease [Hyphomicrobiales bacterium]